MTHKLLVVTYTPDLPQFAMFCHCLAKNWKGNKDLIVVAGKGTDVDRVQQICQTYLDHTWQVAIKHTIPTQLSGDQEQQLNKIIYSVQSGATDVIVFDSKDFLLRACDLGAFKIGNRYKHTYRLPGKLVNLGYDLDQIVNQPVAHLPAVSNLTPWIWNTQQLEACWQHMIDQFGPCEQWSSFNVVSEIYMYYIYVLTTKPNPLEFCLQSQTPCLFAGGWTGQTGAGMMEQAQIFAQHNDSIVWKHSRKLQDPLCLDVTRRVLQQQGIDPAVIQQIYG